MQQHEHDSITGLSIQEVQTRIQDGKANGISKPATKTYGQIIKDNVCTLFNLLNFLIALALIAVHAWSNLVFIAIIITNIIIGIVQEIHAKRLVDQLSILTKPTITVIRDGKEQIVDMSEIVLDDILLLTSGQQVCNDSIVISGTMDANESLLTGESDPISKNIGDSLLSGSSVISGKCYARVTKVGNDNYATSLVKEAQQVKEQNSELMASMRKVTKVTTLFILPLGALLFIEAFLFRHDTMFDSVVATAAGLLGMLPKGLVLLTSVSLANGVTRLAKKQVLVQDLYSLETLSHVDVLCLDKTGTITNGKMKVEQVISLSDDYDIPTIMGSYLNASHDNNATFQAMSDYFSKNTTYHAVHQIPFSSLRKWSAIEFDSLGTIIVGAVEKLIKTPLPDQIHDFMKDGMRAIAMGISSHSLSEDQTSLDGYEVTPLLILLLSDTIRDNTKETLQYFHTQGIETKIISGDNVATVSAIAKKAGVLHAERAIDMSTVQEHDMKRVVNEYSVFGRVTPIQKKQIVEALQGDGHHVAMTGDGVNDLLALKEADCSIAIADGSDASKQISQVVLLNSDFTCLPDVLLEGRKVVNNVTRVAGVFFIKTVYTVLLSLFCVLCNTPFPFIPLQITLIDLLIEAMPSFLTIFESDTRKIHGKFLPTVFKNAIPNAVSIVLLFVYVMLNYTSLSVPMVTTMYLILITVSMVAVIRSCIPFTKLRVAICTMMVSGFIVAIGFLYEMLHLDRVDLRTFVIGMILSAIALVIERIIYHLEQRFWN